LISIAFVYPSIGSLAFPKQLGNLIELAAHDVKQLLRRFNFDKDKSLPSEMTEYQKFVASIYAKFFAGFHGNHQLPSGPKHSSAKALAYHMLIPLLHSRLLNYQTQNYMIYLTNPSNDANCQPNHNSGVTELKISDEIVAAAKI
jgi:hypothetical protein